MKKIKQNRATKEVWKPNYERIKTLKDACEAVGEDFSLVKWKSLEDQLRVIVSALNGDFDYNDDRHLKFIPYFAKKEDALEFAGNLLYDIASKSLSQPEFAFKSPEIAEYASKQFIDYYQKLLL